MVSEMVNKVINRRLLFIFIMASGILLLILIHSCSSSTDDQVPISEIHDTNTPQPKEAPIIIWFHNGLTDTTEALSTALSSGLVNYVMIYCRHRVEVDWQEEPSVLEAIEIVKKSPAKLIWSRALWPYWDQTDIRLEDFFDPNYYIREIQSVRSEAKQMGADFIALDVEAYADSIMKRYLRGRNRLTATQRDELRSMTEEVVQTVGQVEFLYPGEHIRAKQPWNILSRLGKNRIAESTYYSNEDRLKKVKSEYEIFGAYLNIVRTNKRRPHLYFYLVPEIFEKSHRWSDKKGLFLYPKEGSALIVAKELLAYSKTLPATSLIKKQIKDSKTVK